MSEEKTLQKQEPKLSAGERFVNMVIATFSKEDELSGISNHQKNIIMSYFIGVDRALKKAEEERIAKNKWAKADKINDLPYTWVNINQDDLKHDVKYYSKLDLDMMAKNNINAIPYKDTTTNRYDIGWIKGYVGIELEAKRFALEVPANVICELVYSTDEFSMQKKDSQHEIETYTFDIKNPFDRGDIKGGFGYIEYADPKKNKIVRMSYKDIIKHKPKYAAAEFWGGDKDVWKDGKKSGTEHIDGWHEEMCLKTLKRFVFGESNITRDPEKVDGAVLRIKEREDRFERAAIADEIEGNANKLQMPETAYTEVDTGTGEVTEPQPEKLSPTAQAVKDAPGKLPFDEN